MLTWILLAVCAHVLNALVFVIDKGLLGKTESSVSRPAWYAAYSGLVAAGAGFLLAYQFIPPTWSIITWSLAAGVLWILALWLFFTALKHGEPSRVVPIAGSSVPVFTLIFAGQFLGEHLVWQQVLAVALLVVGGVLLSLQIGRGRGVPTMAWVAALSSGAAFAGHFAVSKYIYSWPEPFLALFAYVRLGVGLWAFVVLAALWQQRRPARRRARSALPAVAAGVAVAFVISKVVGMVALLLQNYAIAQGSVSLVNALQGTQYLFVFLLAIIFSRFTPRFFHEELNRVAIFQKVSGILLVSAGLLLLVAQ